MESIFVEEIINGLKEEKFDEATINGVVAEIKRDEQSFAIFMYIYDELSWTPREVADYFMSLSTFVAGGEQVATNSEKINKNNGKYVPVSGSQSGDDGQRQPQ